MSSVLQTCNDMNATDDTASANTQYNDAQNSASSAVAAANDPNFQCKNDPNNSNPKTPGGGKGGGGDTGGGRTAGGDTGTGGSKKGSGNNNGSGFNPMSMLGQALSALQQQPQNNQANNDPTQQLQQASCGPGIVAANCPATGVGTPSPGSWNPSSGSSNFQVASSKNSGFNPADGNTPGTGKTGIPPVNSDPNAQPIPTTQVPNGGGQMPGGQQGGGGASLGGGGGGGGMQLASAHLPDANSLTSHSQFAGMNAGMSAAASGGSGGGYSYGSHGGDQPINYADWLPKGPGAVARALAGGKAQPVQIQSKEVNIWTRISDHIKSRCALGLLRDCVP